MSEMVYKTEIAPATSWSKGIRVFVKVMLNEKGEYLVYGELETPELFGDPVPIVGTDEKMSRWISKAPTTIHAKKLEEAIGIADEMFLDREAWLTKKYN